MLEDRDIKEEYRIAEERSSERRRVLEEFMLEEPIYKVPPLMPPVTVELGQSVQVAVDLMDRTKSGCVLVMAGHELQGIITDRDVFRKSVVPRKDLTQQRVDEIMTRDPVTLRIDDPIAYAFRRMGMG